MSILSGAFAVILFATVSQQATSPEIRVLFVGNSLTSVNDLPSLVGKIASADGRKVTTRTVAFNDFGLPEHWKDGRAVREIRKQRWDFVVLQQGPSALSESRIVLRAFVGKFAPLIREAGARPALYMVWPSLQRKADFPRVSESYALAASDVDGVFLPAGDAWRSAWATHPELPLYGADGFHPSLEGSWLAALAVYCGLTQRPAESVTLPKEFPKPREIYVAAVRGPRSAVR